MSSPHRPDRAQPSLPARSRAPRRLAALLAACAAAATLACGDEEHVNVFHATFTVDGVARDYSTDIGFLNTLGDSYSIDYALDRKQQPRVKDHLQLNLPPDVHPGAVYTVPSTHCLVVYQDAESRWFQANNAGSTMTITVSEWPGRGGYARGTFSAVLSDGEGHTATIAGGAFEGFIHN